jgi:hypothetical protein
MSAFGQQIDRKDFDALFLEGPSQFLVPRMLAQLSKVSQLTGLFGPYKGIGSSEQRWADYQKFDWSIRQLPAIQLFESDTETKEAENGFMNGSVRLMVLWPASFRRSDLSRIPKAFHSAMINFFGSDLAFQLLDSKANTDRTVVVPGLNEIGKEISEAKNVEGVVESELVPVTMIDIRFRIDLRQFYRFLEDDYRTKDMPFEKTLSDLTKVVGEYDGVPSTDAQEVEVKIDQDVTINP